MRPLKLLVLYENDPYGAVELSILVCFEAKFDLCPVQFYRSYMQPASRGAIALSRFWLLICFLCCCTTAFKTRGLRRHVFFLSTKRLTPPAFLTPMKFKKAKVITWTRFTSSEVQWLKCTIYVEAMTTIKLPCCLAKSMAKVSRSCTNGPDKVSS